MNPAARSRVQVEQLKGESDEFRRHGLPSRVPGHGRLGGGRRSLLQVHFVDDTTAEVGLNNYVYTLKKL